MTPSIGTVCEICIYTKLFEFFFVKFSKNLFNKKLWKYFKLIIIIIIIILIVQKKG